jgi:energy-coupling factor transporter ATP-binding protein EcfA2
MSGSSAAAEILAWSGKLDDWQQDGLRRCASTPAVGGSDVDELLAIVKQDAGFPTVPPAPACVPIDATHLGGGGTSPKIEIKAVHNVKNVNSLASTAALTFKPAGLTVVYGANGSGKTGFIRILRSACRTRVSNPQALKVLGNVYSGGTGPIEAEIVIGTAAGDQTVVWKEGQPASELMLRAAVFDSKAAELYVDEGNQIRFLPFGLALPHKLNDLILAVRARLEAEREPVMAQIAATRIDFPITASSEAQNFYKSLNRSTSDVDIEAAAAFSADDDKRCAELEKQLAGSTAEAADRRALAEWLEEIIATYQTRNAALVENHVKDAVRLQAEMKAAREAADLAAGDAFTAEPLKGVGSDTWRRMWETAREYSAHQAYAAEPFPVTGDDSKCVLCHQPLDAAGKERLQRFDAFVTGSLTAKADTARDAYEASAAALVSLDTSDAKDTPARVKQIEGRFPALAPLLTGCAAALRDRHAIVLKILSGDASIDTLPAPSIPPQQEAKAAADDLRAGAKAIEDAALDAAARQTLEAEHRELLDRKRLSTSIATLKARRDLFNQKAMYDGAVDKTQTQGITKRANDLIDKHLTKIVKEAFADECKALNIGHLSVGLSRESKRTEASFRTETGTKLTRTSSEILSEGEQRAVALAAFLTETSIATPDGPIIIDDPVSSLDRERGALVVARIVKEAGKRQVIVFTHDLVFYNELCDLAERAGHDPATCRIFRNTNGAGLLDPSQAEWMGLKVAKRLNVLKTDLAKASKLHNTEPGKYAYEAKNLYSRLREAYERTVEEHLFRDTITRFTPVIKTQNLRYVSLPDDLAVRFHDGMTKANTFSHDNPAAGSSLIPDPKQIQHDIADLESLIDDLRTVQTTNEKNRPTMKP